MEKRENQTINKISIKDLFYYASVRRFQREASADALIIRYFILWMFSVSVIGDIHFILSARKILEKKIIHEIEVMIEYTVLYLRRGLYANSVCPVQ